MVKRCVYCKAELDEKSLIDVCKRCGIAVWGEKMFNAILKNMESAKDEGIYDQGSLSTKSFKLSDKFSSV